MIILTKVMTMQEIEQLNDFPNGFVNGVDIQEVYVEMAERMAGKSYLTFWKSVSYMIRTVVSILLIQFIRPRIQLKEED